MIHHDSNNKPSAMRVGFILSLVMGCILCTSGVFAIFMRIPGGEMLVMTGSGMMTTSGFAKAIQKKWEHRDV